MARRWRRCWRSTMCARPARATAAAVPAGPAGRGRAAGTGRGHPGEPGSHARPRRRHRAHAARRRAAHPDRRRRAAAGGAAGGAADRSGADRRPAGWLVLAAGQRRTRQRAARGVARRPGHGARAGRLSLGRGGPRDLAALRDGLAAGEEARRRWSGPLPRCWPRRARRSPRPPICGRSSGGAGRAGAGPAGRRRHRRRLRRRTGRRTGALRDDSRRVIAALAARLRAEIRGGEPEDPPPRAARLCHRGALGGGGKTAGACRPDAAPGHGERRAVFRTELADLDRRIAEAAERAAARERRCSPTWSSRALREAEALAGCAAALARLDVAQSAAAPGRRPAPGAARR